MLFTPHLLLSVVFVVGVGWALTQRTRAKSEVVTVTVSTTWALDTQCRAIGYLLSEAPGLRRVRSISASSSSLTGRRSPC